MDKGRDRLIDLTRSLQSPFKKRLLSLITTPLEKLFSIPSLNRVYQNFQTHFDNENFFICALEQLKVDYEVSEEDLSKIPAAGPLMVLANHPFGGVDGVVLGAILTSVRKDVKLLANSMLGAIPELRPWMIEVNPFGGKKAARSNISPMKETIRWLRGGGAIGTFPSGTVSHLKLRGLRVTDPEWTQHTAALIRHTKATVVPIYFEGHNSTLFQILGLLSPFLRTALLPRELVKKADSTIKVRIGKAIPFRNLESIDSDSNLVAELRLRTYIQKNRRLSPRRKIFRLRRSQARPVHHEPVMPPVPPDQLEDEINQLPLEHCLVDQKDFAVFVAEAWQIPQTLQELGRLREQTFREVGEGTGTCSDLDRFDRSYLHLFLWNRNAREIVGAYRIGKVDEILARSGIEGLYTSTLFQYDPRLFDRFALSLELGRSFICSEYQKKRSSLSLLWRGIGEYIVRHPHYHILFGPVSISSEYNPISKHLMVRFLKDKKTHTEYSHLVRAKKPHRQKRLKGLDKKAVKFALRDVENVSALVSEIEKDNKGLPILLRHYLKLNGILLSFNIDRAFSHVLDGLILVDLKTTDPRLLKRYLGVEGYQKFKEFHSPAEALL